jgi:transcriptional regulator with XRE-family HTH domain
MFGYTQSELGDKLGVCFQQIQKYENGLNKVSAHNLYGLSMILRTTVGYFFEGYNKADKSAKINTSYESIELLKKFEQINNPLLKKQVKAFINQIAKVEENG